MSWLGNILEVVERGVEKTVNAGRHVVGAASGVTCGLLYGLGGAIAKTGDCLLNNKSFKKEFSELNSEIEDVADKVYEFIAPKKIKSSKALMGGATENVVRKNATKVIIDRQKIIAEFHNEMLPRIQKMSGRMADLYSSRYVKLFYMLKEQQIDVNFNHALRQIEKNKSEIGKLLLNRLNDRICLGNAEIEALFKKHEMSTEDVVTQELNKHVENVFKEEKKIMRKMVADKVKDANAHIIKVYEAYERNKLSELKDLVERSIALNGAKDERNEALLNELSHVAHANLVKYWAEQE